jgi:hypothetical protein
VKTLDRRVAAAVRMFWSERKRQGGGDSAEVAEWKGERAAVTGGKHMNGFVSLICDLIEQSGVPGAHIHRNRKLELPGFFRAEKKWDLVIVAHRTLIGAMELKSISGSFGNNLNNRAEEALGNATDLLTAYREGAFPGERPWLGYLFLLNEVERSIRPVRNKEPHFKVFPEFKGASYAKRAELFCERLVREGLYSAACLILPDGARAKSGHYREPNPDLTFRKLMASLAGRLATVKWEQEQA